MRVRFVLFIALLPLVAAAAPATDDRYTYMVRLQGQSLVEHVHARVASQNLAVAEGGEKPAMRRELRSSRTLSLAAQAAAPIT